jgi:plastocyanin
MSCGSWLEAISAGADGELDAADVDALAHHLRTCPGCQVLADAIDGVRRRSLVAPAMAVPDLAARVLHAREAEVAGGRTLRRRVAGVIGVAAAIVAAVVVPAVTGGSGPGGSGADYASGAAAVVHVDGGGFSAPAVTVAAGSTVAWHNHSGADHHLVHEGGDGTVATDLEPGQAETATFAEPGTYRYFCTLHEGMTGHVVVHS